MIGLIEDQQPLLNIAEPVVPLQFEHVWRCAQTWTSTHERDPLMRYLRATPVPSPLANASDTVTMAAMLLLLMHRNVALTIKRGEGFIIVKPPANNSSQSSINFMDRLRDTVVTGLQMIINRDLFFLPENQKRNEETNRKVDDAVKFVFGDRVKEMFHISIFANNADNDLLNHAGALLDAVTGLADLVDQAIWVKSTHSAQSAIFRSHGFKTMAEVVLGDQNPGWHEIPILVDIMVREPRGRP